MNLPSFRIERKVIEINKEKKISVSTFCEIMQYCRFGNVKKCRFEGYYKEEPCIICVEFECEKISILISDLEYIDMIKEKLEKRNSLDYS